VSDEDRADSGEVYPRLHDAPRDAVARIDEVGHAAHDHQVRELGTVLARQRTGRRAERDQPDAAIRRRLLRHGRFQAQNRPHGHAEADGPSECVHHDYLPRPGPSCRWGASIAITRIEVQLGTAPCRGLNLA
jgi:hypothetical protein